MKIKYQTHSTIAAQTWELNTEFPSQAMALEYGSKIVRDFIHCSWFMELTVWNMDKEELLGIIRLREATGYIAEAK